MTTGKVDRWLTLDEAAKRVGVSKRTIQRYVARDGLMVRFGHVRESQLLEVNRTAHIRMVAGQVHKRL